MPKEIPYGYCHCGCGQKTKIAKENRKRRGWIKGEPIEFIHGHNARLAKREKGSGWKGGETNKNGYTYILQGDHPRAKANVTDYVPRSHLVVEAIMGKCLPDKVVVHHVDENRKNDFPNNLVVCEDKTYHALLHQRLRALKACGHVDWVKCPYCKQYGNPENMVKRSTHFAHRECKNKYEKERRRNIKWTHIR